jgi:hypothetical protein
MNKSQRSFFRASLISMQKQHNLDYSFERDPLIIKDDSNGLSITEKSGRISSRTIEMVQATAVPMCAICWSCCSGDEGETVLRIF